MCQNTITTDSCKLIPINDIKNSLNNYVRPKTHHFRSIQAEKIEEKAVYHWRHFPSDSPKMLSLWRSIRSLPPAAEHLCSDGCEPLPAEQGDADFIKLWQHLRCRHWTLAEGFETAETLPGAWRLGAATGSGRVWAGHPNSADWGSYCPAALSARFCDLWAFRRHEWYVTQTPTFSWIG